MRAHFHSNLTLPGEKKKQSPNLVDMEADRGSWRTLLRRSIGAVFNFRRCLFELRLDEARGPTLLLQLCGIVIKVRRETQEQTARSDMQRTPRPDWHIQWITAALNFVQRHFELRLDRAGQLTLLIVLRGIEIESKTKDWVPLYYSGCTTASIHRRDPTTERHGGFDLLRFRPGPVHPSLDDLVVPGSPRSTISIPNLVRTPDRHSPLQLRAPELKRSSASASR
ncbi:hypothetical protein WMY93_018458 [Mugilogobius chulae]|uniref:Uncharacterized protein n=1 Tax=Mugilogobius chulae TaxID=88201 RepID=A0AAW0NW61_9GOBI